MVFWKNQNRWIKGQKKEAIQTGTAVEARNVIWMIMTVDPFLFLSWREIRKSKLLPKKSPLGASSLNLNKKYIQ